MTMSTVAQAMIFGSLLAITITVNAFAFDLQAVQNRDQPYLKQFNQLDNDANGQLTMRELEKDAAVNPELFKANDRDGDGRLNVEEFSALKSHNSQLAIKRVMADSWMTAKVKAKLLEETALNSLRISVETHQGEVLISGFVDDATLKAKIEQLVAGVAGVTSVKNAIVVKS